MEPWMMGLRSFFLIFFIYAIPYEGALDNAYVIVSMAQIVVFFFLSSGILRRAFAKYLGKLTLLA